MFWKVDEELLALVKSCEIFSSLKTRELRYLIKVTEVTHLEAGKILFNVGDESDCMYVLLQGLLISYLPTKTSNEKIIGYVNPGQIAGESSFISSRKRLISAKAIHDSKLLKISKEVFDQSLKNFPELLMHLLNVVINRAKNTFDAITSLKKPTVIAFIPATEDIPLQAFLMELQNAPFSQQKIKILMPSELNELTTKQNPKNTFDQLIEQFDVIIFPANTQHETFQKQLIQYTEQIAIIAKGNTRLAIDDHTKQFLKDDRYRHIKKDLILLYENPNDTPTHTLHWLKGEHFHRHHHVRFQMSDYLYLLRYFSGEMINLVLSGGGTKGWLEIGVMKALIDNNIPIDAIGGTSAGAIIGAHYLLYQDYQQLCEDMHYFCKTLENIFSPFNFTYPLVSVLNGKNRTQAFKKIFGDHHIENLWRPFFCVSANLTENRESIHHQGPIWRWVCASSSIPGLFPPITHGGNVHLDGGVINNLPTDVMRQSFGQHGKIIAVDLTLTTSDIEHYHFPPTITFLDAFLYKLRIKKYRHYRFPTFTTTILESLMLGSLNKAIDNMPLADILIRPNLSKYKMIGSLKYAQEMIDLGYTAMTEKIPQLKQPQQPVIS